MEEMPALTELIDVEILQRIQDGFSKYSQMASITTDENGAPVTKGSGFSHFCMDLTRNTPEGFRRCMNCDKMGALETARNGKVAVYTCHAGLVDYAAPIIADGKIIGNFIGGQVLTEKFDEQKFRLTARELGIDEEKYIAALRQIPVIDRREVERAAEFLGVVATILSEIAYSSYKSILKNSRLTETAKSQTDFVIRRNLELRDNVYKWLEKARAVAAEKSKDYRELLGNIEEEGAVLVDSLEDSAEFVRLTEGRVGFQDSVYNIEDLCNMILEGVVIENGDNGNRFEVTAADGCPKEFYGDTGLIGKILVRLIKNSLCFTKDGVIRIKISAEKEGYATILALEISDSGIGMTEEQLRRGINSISQQSMRSVLPEGETSPETEMNFLAVGMLVRQLNGCIQLDSQKGRGTTFLIKVPQLASNTAENGGGGYKLWTPKNSTRLLKNSSSTWRKSAMSIR